MVSLSAIRESNARIATSLPSGLVAIFVGATSGIGETSLRNLVKRTRQPRIYFLGRREEEGRRIQAELEKLNPEGKYHYLKYDLSLLKNVDEACREIQSQESVINLLLLSSGTLITGKQTEEGLNYAPAVGYYGRTRFILNLLPQLKRASGLRRVVTVAAGGKEGKIFTDDFQANNICVLSIRGHTTSMITLALHAISKQAPEVSFLHVYPGFVKTGLSRELKGVLPAIAKVLFAPLVAYLHIPIEETGERQTYFPTSARFPPGSSEQKDADGVALGEGVDVAVGVDGKLGGGVYSIDYEAEGTAEKVQHIIRGYIEDGTAEKVWKHTEEEYVRVTGTVAYESG
ncbi:hypothetical protein O1611_g5709 [Lasiodiplodia mahajangana]|uniref:Uncharacterized protein n=1 Tax=Lasiodiplodia mahajangana TaxID=1108764 RepID=A0ACC2JL43_9PEZI|nr:hypothetical protein O1611_g5709 [Lasiodiplodia mahajangana]